MDNGIQIFQFGDSDFDKYKKELLGKQWNVWCSNKIPRDFLENTLDNVDYLLINFSINGIIGFASVIEEEEHLYIDLICNAPGTKMNLKSRKNSDFIRLGAKQMINEIERLCSTLKKRYIKLSALDDVILYYHRLGFKFEIVYNEEKTTMNAQ